MGSYYDEVDSIPFRFYFATATTLLCFNYVLTEHGCSDDLPSFPFRFLSFSLRYVLILLCLPPSFFTFRKLSLSHSSEMEFLKWNCPSFSNSPLEYCLVVFLSFWYSPHLLSELLPTFFRFLFLPMRESALAPNALVSSFNSALHLLFYRVIFHKKFFCVIHNHFPIQR